MKKLSLLAFSALGIACLYGCVNGTVSDGAQVSEQVAIPGTSTLLDGGGLASSLATTLTFTYPVDITSAMSNLTQFGPTTLAVKASTLTGDNLAFVENVSIQLQPNDGSSPAVEVASLATVSNGGNTLNLPVENEATLLQYLTDKADQLTIAITVNLADLPTNEQTLTYNLTVAASVKIDKSL